MNYLKSALVALFFIILYLLPQDIFSVNIEKANLYYEKYDYKFALAIYEKVMLKQPSLEVAQKLANCYRFINDSENAEAAYARVLTYPDADPQNYRYYADALKQNSKFAEARENYISYGVLMPERAEEASRMANACDMARMWAENPDANVHIENEELWNSENSDFSPVRFKEGYAFISDRWFEQGDAGKKSKQVYGWTGNPYLKLYELNEADGRMLRINVMPQPINFQYHTGPAVFSVDGQSLYFTRTLLDKRKKSKGMKIGRNSIYVSSQGANGWSEPVMVSLGAGDKYSVQHPALAPDGSILYFASDMPGGFGGMDLYASRRQSDGSWGEPVNCGSNINSAEDDVFPVVNQDGKFYFSSKGHIGMGGLDLFSANGSYNNFSVAENLRAPFNSSKDDFGILFSDTDEGYISSNRKGGKGLDDIYHFSRVENQPAQPVFALEGQVIEKTTGSYVAAVSVNLVNLTTGAEQAVRSDGEGRFHFDLEAGMDYALRGDDKKFFSRKQGQISTKNLKESTVFTVKFELERSEDAYIVRLNNIYYNFNKWDLRADAFPELNRVADFLNRVQEVKIELRSHTDSRGPAAYNLLLSQKRAESVVSYLKKKGISSGRLKAVGLGETQLLNQCSSGVKCSGQQHQLNRRTEFKVIRAE